MSALPNMSVRMARIAPSTPVERPVEAPSMTVNDDAPLAEVDLASALSLALARSGMSHKQAAITQGIDVAQWSRQVNGQEAHVSLQRLTKAHWQAQRSTCSSMSRYRRKVRCGAIPRQQSRRTMPVTSRRTYLRRKSWLKSNAASAVSRWTT